MRNLALALMSASGFAGLGYQVVWTQQTALMLGHESAAVLAVVAAFFGGLAVGAFTLGDRIARSMHPARWYAACEALIGAWALTLTTLLRPATAILLHLPGPAPSPVSYWTIAFGGTFVLLLPATAAMGATLPAIERVLASFGNKDSLEHKVSSIGALYAANTFGAVLGVLVSSFALIPMIGLLRTVMLCGLLNLVCALIALSFDSAARAPTHPAHPVPPLQTRAARTLSLLAMTGLLGIAYEVLVVRALSQIAENTVFTFAILLAVYLIGTSLGAAFYARFNPSEEYRPELTATILRWLAWACLLGILSLAVAVPAKTFVLHKLVAPSFGIALTIETLLALAAFVLPTIVMGALFSHLATSARDSGIEFGRILSVNTLGAALAPLLFGTLLLPAFGLRLALLLVPCVYLLLSAPWRWPRSRPIEAIALACVALLAIWAPTLNLVDLPPGSHLVSREDGVMSTVTVVEDSEGVSRLHIDNHVQEGSSATYFSDARQALLPILLHPAPRRALFLGLGTGVTATAATLDPMIEVDAVELIPEVIHASRFFAADKQDVSIARLHVTSADARRFVRVAQHRYDVIVSDNFHPARSGSGSLYTVEHFAAVRDRLEPGGVFCQWLPLHQLDLNTLRTIVRSFLQVYPQAWAILATNSLQTPVVGLLARRDGEKFSLKQTRARRENTSLNASASQVGIPDELALLGSVIADADSLSQFSEGALLNTDDRPVVSYLAPRATYAPVSTPADRLFELIRVLKAHPAALLATSPDSDSDGDAHADTGADPDDRVWARRLAAYWQARNQFLEAGRGVEPNGDVRRMLDHVREPLLAVLRTSPDFRPAYDPLLQMANALGTISPGDARDLLRELEQIQPAWPDAARALQRLAEQRGSGAAAPKN